MADSSWGIKHILFFILKKKKHVVRLCEVMHEGEVTEATENKHEK